MKYTPAERLAIGKRIYENELNRYQAAIEYGISEQTARNYMRMYRNARGLQPKNRCGGCLWWMVGSWWGWFLWVI